MIFPENTAIITVDPRQVAPSLGPTEPYRLSYHAPYVTLTLQNVLPVFSFYQLADCATNW